MSLSRKAGVSTNYIGNKEFYGKLAGAGNEEYRKALEIYPEPSDWLSGTILLRMISLWEDIKSAVDIAAGDHDVVKTQVQHIVNTRHDSYPTEGVWTTLSSNQPKLYSYLRGVGVYFTQIEKVDDGLTKNLFGNFLDTPVN